MDAEKATELDQAAYSRVGPSIWAGLPEYVHAAEAGTLLLRCSVGARPILSPCAVHIVRVQLQVQRTGVGRLDQAHNQTTRGW